MKLDMHRHLRTSDLVVIVFLGLWLTLLYGVSFDDVLWRKSRLAEIALEQGLGTTPPLTPQIKLFRAGPDTGSKTLDKLTASSARLGKLVKTLNKAGVEKVVFDHSLGQYPNAMWSNKITPLYQKFTAVIWTTGMTDSPVAGQKKQKLLPGAAELPTKERVYFDDFVPPPQEYFLRQIPRGKAIQFGYRSIGAASYPPFRRLNSAYVLPHTALALGRNFQVKKGRPYLDDQHLTVNRNGQLALPNIALDHGPQTYDLAKALRSGKYRRQISKEIRKGDVALVSLDPFGGRQPVASLMGPTTYLNLLAVAAHATVTQEWPTVIHYGSAAVILLTLVFWGCVTRLPLKWSGIATGSLLGLFLLLSLSSRLLFQYYTDWLTLLLSGTAVWGLGLTTVILANRINQGRLRQVFEPTLASKDLVILPNTIADPAYKPREVFVTIMFVDFVGLAALGERLKPDQAIKLLDQSFTRVKRSVNKHGGMLLGRPGDNAMGIFGYRFESKQVTSDHSDNAFACAIDLQKQFLELNLQASKENKPQVPLRIGINTAGIYVGLSGYQLYVTGHGINFTKRIEMLCEPYQILISPSTRSTLTTISFDDPAMQRKMIEIKHQKEPFAAYEFNPFHKMEARLTEAISSYQKSLGLERADRRINLKEPLVFKSDHGNGEVNNFSRGGLAVKTFHYLARGMKIKLNFKEGQMDGELYRLIEGLTCEVRWGRPYLDGYLHGLKFLNLDLDQKDLLLQKLQEYANPEPAAAPDPESTKGKDEAA